jgi:glycosyltransferase involved in cell wall biosynthesis
MNWLFIHQNFPAQYRHVVRHLVDAGDRVIAIGQQCSAELPGVWLIRYAPPPTISPTHEHLHEFDAAVQNALAVARACEQLKGEGFVPDIVIGHNGWGETLFVKDVLPNIPLLNYFEFFYRAVGGDTDFDPEFAPGADIALQLRTRNAVNLLGLDAADWGQTPTQWQRDHYPRCYWDRISVIHEGIDTGFVRPDPTARLWLRGGVSLSRDDEVITYNARNLEPYRGFHIFMRALPKILQRRPQATVLIVGGDGVSYGTRPALGGGWRQQLLQEVGAALDLRRVHFLGYLGFRQYLSVLQLSAVHVYLTYPFVLSWSLLEALSVGCLVIASRTPPVEEIISDGENGYLFDFFDVDGLADRVVEVLKQAETHRHITANARASVIARYDLKGICLPAYLSLLQRLTGKRVPGAPLPNRNFRNKQDTSI